MSTPKKNGRTITFAQAVNEALAEEMRRDPTVFIIGEDVAEAGPALPVAAHLVQPYSRPARGRAVYSLRCQGSLQNGYPGQ